MKNKSSKQRLIAVAILAMVMFAVLISNLELFYIEGVGLDPSLGLIVMFMVGSCLLLSAQVTFGKKINHILILVLFFLLPMSMIYVVELLAGNDLQSLASNVLWLNVIWCQLFYCLVFAITNHFFWTVCIGTMGMFLVAVVNSFVLLYKGNPLLPWDILSVGTAMNVAGNYEYHLTVPLLLAGAMTLFCIALASWVTFSRKRRTVLTVCYSVLLLFGVYQIGGHFYESDIWSKENIAINTWDQGLGYRTNGTVLSIAMNASFLFLDTPSDYLPAKVEGIFENFLVSEAAAAVEEIDEQSISPNIIVIMNESYTDYRVIKEFETTLPYMEFYDSLEENTIKGYTATSVLGGGTSNSEFEFLTGNSMAFLPSGSMAYQQYIQRELPSLASQLQEQGYQTIAIHPAEKTNWMRHKVYPLLGFQQFLNIDDFEDPQWVRDAYVSDQANYEKIIQLYEQKKEQDRLFIFDVTIQNHGGYQLDTVGISQWISISDEEYQGEGKAQVEQFLSLIKQSDLALEYLIQYFEQQEEPTIILFFGDHQPSLPADFLEYLFEKPLDQLDLQEIEQRYMTPFMIWANYPIPAQQDEVLSLNYLAALLLEHAGVKQSPYQEYLLQLAQQLPIVNAIGYMDADGNYYKHAYSSEYTTFLEEYRMVQYNYLFDYKNRLLDLFSTLK